MDQSLASLFEAIKRRIALGANAGPTPETTESPQTPASDATQVIPATKAPEQSEPAANPLGGGLLGFFDDINFDLSDEEASPEPEQSSEPAEPSSPSKPVDQTQIIAPSKPTQPVTAATQVIPKPTQVIANRTQEDESPLPLQTQKDDTHMDITVTEADTSIDQTHAPASEVTQADQQQSEPESDGEVAPLTEAERRAKIEQLIAEKRAQRLAEQEKLTQQIADRTLTDDERDMDADTSVVGQRRDVTLRKEIEAAEQFLAVQGRQRTIRPQFTTTQTYSKDQLVANFDSDDDTGMEAAPQQSLPHTSPVQPQVDKERFARYAGIEPENDGAIDLGLDLDSDIPEVPKDMVLEIQLKFLRRYLKTQGPSSIPVSVRKMIPAEHDTHRMEHAIKELKRINLAQLHEMKVSDPNYGLLEELEKDEEVMGGLLEQEIERARKIRRQEKRRARLAQAAKEGKEGEASDALVADSVYSGSENEGLDEENSGSEGENSEENEAQKSDSGLVRGNDDIMFEQSSPTETETEDRGIVAKKQTILQQPSLDAKEEVSLPQFAETQAIEGFTSLTQTQKMDLGLETQSQEAPTQLDLHSDDDQIITPAAVNRGRRQIKLAKAHDDESDAEEANEDAPSLSPEEMAARQKAYEDKVRRAELRARKRRKALESLELKKIFEGEAVESEDEWHGIGGADGEALDAANSEDERMIDNALDLDLNDDEVRRKFMEQYQIKDHQELEKLIDDIKNHRLTKRSGAGLDIELSDEEDAILMAYRRQRRQEQLARLAAQAEEQKRMATDKLKPFFAVMEERPLLISLDLDLSLESEEEPLLRNKISIREEFVQRQLSFLNAEPTQLAKLQHEVDEDIDELSVLKSRCLSSLGSGAPAASSQAAKRPLEVDEETDADDDDLMPLFKRPLVVQSFRTTDENSFLGVTVNKQYKVAAGAKALILALAKSTAKKVAVKLSKQELIEATLTLARLNRSNVFTTGLNE